jgi:hypothetical protein
MPDSGPKPEIPPDGPTHVFVLVRIRIGTNMLGIFALPALALIIFPYLGQTLTPMPPPRDVPAQAAEPRQTVSIEQPGKMPVIASDLTKEFVGLVQDARDSVDRLCSALEFSRINWEAADLGSQSFIQKMDRATKTKGQKYIADSVKDYRKEMLECRSGAAEMLDNHADPKEYNMYKGLCILGAYVRGTNIAKSLSPKSGKKKTPAKAAGAEVK